MTKAENEGVVEVAKRNPRRSPQEFVQLAIQSATLSPEIAEGCFYSLKRKDRRTGTTKEIRGPSIRLAEIASSLYQNIRVGGMPIAETFNTVTARGICYDLENNVYVSRDVSVPITGRNGRRYSQDMIEVTRNAAVAKAMRNAIFSCIPKAFLSMIEAGIGEFLSESEREAPEKHEKRVQSMIRSFASIGVDEVLLLKRLGVESRHAIDAEKLKEARGIWVAIEERESSISEEFGVEEDEDEGGKDSQEIVDALGGKDDEAEELFPAE